MVAPAFYTKITYVYIDGFNLYYRAIKNTPYKWLDLKSLLQKLLSKNHRIEAIKYFTAVVSGRKDPQKPLRQQAYIKALRTFTPEVSIHYGQFLSHVKKAPLANPTKTKRFEYIVETKEKGSDVNLAVHLLNDAWLDRYDCAVVVSNDSDLAEAIRLVKMHHKKLIGLILPTKCFPSKALIALADFVKRIRVNALAKSQLPNPIPGTLIHKPPGW